MERQGGMCEEVHGKATGVRTEQILHRAGLISDSEVDCGSGTDLLRRIWLHWRRAGAVPKRRATMMRWCERAIVDGAQLTVHRATLRDPHESTSLHLGWWPYGIPDGIRWAIVSSRLGKQLDRWHAWFAAFRSACDRCTGDDVLCTVQGTTCDPYLRHVAKRSGIPIIQGHFENGKPERWRNRMVAGSSQRGAVSSFPVWFSPDLARPTSAQWKTNRDAGLIRLADRVVACYVRSGGNVERLLRNAQQDPLLPRIEWGDMRLRVEPRNRLSRTPQAVRQSRTIPYPYLVHCTRAYVHTPRDPRTEAALDAMLLRDSHAAWSAIGVLKQILNSRCLRAMTATRSGMQVVCLADISLSDLHRYRTYQPHRMRWDFEPYGIGVCRDWLLRHGARRVIYGDERTWRDLDGERRALFQPMTTRSARQNWWEEREWRMPADLNLDELPADRGFVFTAFAAEVDELYAVSPWPVLSLNS